MLQGYLTHTAHKLHHPPESGKGEHPAAKAAPYRNNGKSHYFHVAFLKNVRTINADEELAYTSFLPAGLPSLNSCAVPSDSVAQGTTPVVEEAI
jgi:hypothetical protein